MSRLPTILVLGGGGSIGSVLCRHFRDRGDVNLVSAGRKTVHAPGHCVFDALDDRSWKSLPVEPSVVFFCFGATSIATCQAEAARTRTLNVDAPFKLAQRLADQGAHLVFFSTSLVFDGRHPGARPCDPRRPGSEYARQKVEIENRLRELAECSTILRATKFQGSLAPLITDWAARLRSNQPVEPFYDRRIAPFDDELLMSAVDAVIGRGALGIYHLSGEADFSYHQLAVWVARSTDADTELIQPVSAREKLGELGESTEVFSWPASASLDMTKTSDELKVYPTPLSRFRRFVAECVEAQTTLH